MRPFYLTYLIRVVCDLHYNEREPNFFGRLDNAAATGISGAQFDNRLLFLLLTFDVPLLQVVEVKDGARKLI